MQDLYTQLATLARQYGAQRLVLFGSRNVTSHVYDEQTAIEVADRVCSTYLPILQKLDNFYRQ